jgi:hypothetical protein
VEARGTRTAQELGRVQTSLAFYFTSSRQRVASYTLGQQQALPDFGPILRMITSLIIRKIRGREGGMADEIHLPTKLEPGALAPASPTHLVPALTRSLR